MLTPFPVSLCVRLCVCLACEAIRVLSTSAPNLVLLGEAGASSTVLTAYRLHYADSRLSVVIERAMEVLLAIVAYRSFG